MQLSPKTQLRRVNYINNAFGLSCFKWKQKTQFWHNHDFFEMAFVLEGSGFHKTIQSKTVLTPGFFCLMNVGEYHCYEFEKDLILFNLLVLPEFLQKIKPLLPQGPWLEKSFFTSLINHKTMGVFEGNFPISQWQGVKKNLLGLAEASQANSEKIYPRFLDLAFDLKKNLEATKTDLKREKNSVFTQSMDYFNTNFFQNIDLKNLAEQLGLSSSAFSKKFRQETGYSPTEYLNDLRIQKACELLLQTTTPIKDIGPNCGFPQTSLFYEVFKRLTGMTPFAYRVIRGEEFQKNRQPN